MRSKWFFLVVGLALVLGPSLGSSQQQPGGFPPGGGGFGGGGAGGFGGGRGAGGFGGGGGFSMDPTQIWNSMGGTGKEVLTKADITNPFMQGMFDRMVQTMGITTGQITRDQFVTSMQQRM